MVGATQQQLADKVGVKFQQVQKYETGMNRVSASRLWDIAAALDVPISFFFEGIANPGDERSSPDIDKSAVELMTAYLAVGPDQRHSLLTIARTLQGATPHVERTPS